MKTSHLERSANVVNLATAGSTRDARKNACGLRVFKDENVSFADVKIVGS